MFVPSSLPNFEIPTGLMASGLDAFRGFGRGLGAVSVGPIAQAQFSGQLKPSFLPTQYFTAGYSNVPQALPTWLYATQAFASQIAGLLGGSVVSAPPPGNYQGTGIPNTYWVQLGDGTMVLPGNLLQPGTILSFEDECSSENYFQQSIPGSVLSATCAAGGTGMTPAQLAQSKAPPPPVYAVPPPTPIAPTGTTPPIAVIPEPVQTPVALSPIPSSSQTAPANQTAVQPAAQQPGTMQGSQQQQTQQQAPATTNDNTTLYIGLGIAALVVLFAFKGKT